MELFTVFTLICALLCGFCTWRCWIAVDQCDAHADGLKSQLAKVTALEAEVSALQTAHNRLRGRFYAQLSREPEFAAIVPDRAAERIGEAACENWAKAQYEGPRSKAASCLCDYCEAQRVERARVRAAILPQARTAPRGNGSE